MLNTMTVYLLVLSSLIGVEEGKARMDEGGHDEEVASSEKQPNGRLACKNRYPIYDQNG